MVCGSNQNDEKEMRGSFFSTYSNMKTHRVVKDIFAKLQSNNLENL